MQDGVGPGGLNRAKDVAVGFGLGMNELRARVHGGTMAFGKIVIDGDMMAGVEQFLDANRTNVTRTARDEDVHVLVGYSEWPVSLNGEVSHGCPTDRLKAEPQTVAPLRRKRFCHTALGNYSRPMRIFGKLPFAGALLLSVGLASRAGGAQVKLGNEVLAGHKFKELAGKRVGLITNPSGVNRKLESTIDVLRAAPVVKLVALFGPEHGVYGDVWAGDKIEGQTDAHTGLPVHSLYGKTRKPTPAMLKGLDALVYDLQDTGCRSYTFISTMGVAMEACGEAGVEFIVLDRPNPLGGERVEGPLIESEKYRSFVSRWDVPYVYGLTCGELARMINAEGWIKPSCQLTVVPMKGWKRTMVWRDTGLPWVPTSPHLPHDESALFQVATGMIGEIGGASTGIGYPLPFQCVAAPDVDKHKLAAALNGYGLPGVRFVPVSYKPYYFSFSNQPIAGVQIYFTNPREVPLTPINFYAMEALKKVAGRDLFDDAAKTNKKFDMFDKVNGTAATRLALQSGKSAAEIVVSWKAGEEKFRAQRRKYLLY
jgi:uncharacterized protein YbbC (DUF1343 family)